jgi:WD40-like Beta Propeller Repeat
MLMRKAVPASLVLLAWLSICCGRNRESRIVVLRHTVRIAAPVGQVVPSLVYRVWRVGGNGRVVPLPYGFSDSYFDSVEGSTAPSPSPDGRWIAYGNGNGDYEIHLLNVGTLRQLKITHWGAPPTIRSVSVNVLIDGWSPDSRRLLLNVTPGEDTTERGDLAIPKALYGFYEYDVASGRTTPVRLPARFAFVAWIPGGCFVGVLPGGFPPESHLVMLRPGQGGATRVTTLNASLYQTRVSMDGKWLVGLHTENGGQPGKGPAQIVKVNLRTMAVRSLMTLNWWSGNEQPALSPDDKQVAYKREKLEHETYYTPREGLFVDGRRIYSCPGPIDFKWVDDRMIALACQDDVLVLDADGGTILSKNKLGERRRH